MDPFLAALSIALIRKQPKIAPYFVLWAWPQALINFPEDGSLQRLALALNSLEDFQGVGASAGFMGIGMAQLPASGRSSATWPLRRGQGGEGAGGDGRGAAGGQGGIAEWIERAAEGDGKYRADSGFTALTDKKIPVAPQVLQPSSGASFVPVSPSVATFTPPVEPPRPQAVPGTLAAAPLVAAGAGARTCRRTDRDVKGMSKKYQVVFLINLDMFLKYP